MSDFLSMHTPFTYRQPLRARLRHWAKTAAPRTRETVLRRTDPVEIDRR